MIYTQPPATLEAFREMILDAENTGTEELIHIMQDDYSRRRIAEVLQFEADEYDRGHEVGYEAGHRDGYLEATLGMADEKEEEKETE